MLIVLVIFCSYISADLRICEMYLTKPEVLKEFNPQDLTNTTWGFCKVGFIHKAAMDTLARECYNQRQKFLFGGFSFYPLVN